MLTSISSDWIRLATEIELNYAFDAFVILHGTDTMSYTSSALSFLLEDLGKTVVRKSIGILSLGIMLTKWPMILTDRYGSSNTFVAIKERCDRQPNGCTHDSRTLHHTRCAPVV